MRVFWTWLFVFCAAVAGGQDTYIDSLEQLLGRQLPDTERVLVLADLAFAKYNNAAEEAVAHARQAIELSEAIGYKKGLTKGYYSLAASLFARGKFEEALQACDQVLFWAKELKNQGALRAVYNLQGVIFRQWGKPEKALEPLFALLKLSEENGDFLDAGLAAQNIGTVYLDINAKELAKKYLLLSEENFIRAGVSEYLPGTYSNLSAATENADEKIYYLKKAEQLTEDASELAYIYHNLGGFYFVYRNNPDSARYFFEKSMALSKEIGDVYEQMVLLGDFGDFLYKQGVYDEAEKYLLEGISLAESLGQLPQKIQIEEVLSELYAARGEYHKAYQQLKEVLDNSDSVYVQSLKDAQAEADARYENERTKAELALKELALEQEKNFRRQILFAAVVLLLLMAMAAYLYSVRQRAKKQAAELQAYLEQQEAERLRQLDELKTQFFNNIAHEYRTPLSLVLSYVEELMKSMKGSDAKEYLKELEEQAQRLLHLTDEILELARLDGGEIPLHAHPCLLPETLRRVSMAYASAAQSRGIVWTYTYEGPDDLLVNIDEGKLEAIVNNLLGNALKFTPAGKSVRITTRITSSVLEFSVYNEGEGILEKDLPHIFKRFYRGVHNERGSGIGLAFAKELCELMGGTLSVESVYGQYARFVLTLPLEVLKHAPTNASPKPGANWEPTLKPDAIATILLVEDQEDMARYLSRLLSNEGYAVHHQAEGKAALAWLEGHTADLIISDVSMPGMSGFAFRQMLLSHEQWKNIPFVFLTARVREEDRLRGFQYGVDDYIVKPFSARELCARLRVLLEKKKIREEVRKEEASFSTAEEQFVADLERIALENLDNPSFGVEELAAKANYSRRQLARLLKAATGLSPVQFLLEIRLQRAYQLLKSRRYRTVSEVRYAVGIESASYFSRKFTERFGVKPSEV